MSAFKLAEHRCSDESCGEIPSYVGVKTRTEVVWACGQHDATVAREEPSADMYSMTPTCRYCAENATHVVINDDYLPISVCEQHVGRV